MTKRKDGELKVTNHDYEWQPKFYGVIVGLFCSIYMVDLAIASKMVDIYGFVTSAGLFVFPICSILSDVLTEVYGFNRTRQAIWTVIAGTILFTALTKMAVMMTPASFWPHQEAYEKVFELTWRIMLAGIGAWMAGEFMNSYVMSKMKIFQKAKNMPMRFIGSTVAGQFFDTIVFFLIAFAGTMPWDKFLLMMVTAWGFKVAYETVALPISIPVTNWVKRLEGVEHFDKQKISVI